MLWELGREQTVKKADLWGKRTLPFSREQLEGGETGGSDPCNLSVITQQCHLSYREGDLETS